MILKYINKYLGTLAISAAAQITKRRFEQEFRTKRSMKEQTGDGLPHLRAVVGVYPPLDNKWDLDSYKSHSKFNGILTAKQMQASLVKIKVDKECFEI